MSWINGWLYYAPAINGILLVCVVFLALSIDRKLLALRSYRETTVKTLQENKALLEVIQRDCTNANVTPDIPHGIGHPPLDSPND
jgi:hypothetical protein